MKSPISGKEMSIQTEGRIMTFRKEEFMVRFRYYFCEDSGHKFTSTEFDEINLNLLHNEYRSKHNLLFVNQIKEIRSKYGLSVKLMSELLGFGANTYSNYEKGEVPNTSNNNLIKMIEDPVKFKDLVLESNTLDEANRDKLIKKIEHIILEDNRNHFSRVLTDFLMGSSRVDAYSGYRAPDLQKFTEMVVFFSHTVQPYKTVLNKLLFYSDFLCFKHYYTSISGTRYQAFDWGPVPNKFQSLFEFMQAENEIDIITSEFPSGAIGEVFKPNAQRPINSSLFSDEELEILERVAKKFKGMSAQKVSKMSHEEVGWIENRKDRSQISYLYAFDLVHID